MTEEQLEKAIDMATSALIAYNNALNNWNGDSDGPKERAIERLQKDFSLIIDDVCN